jgi:orotate phosphoribosyltransferase
MISLAAEEGYVKEEELETLQEWRKNPSQWRQNE